MNRNSDVEVAVVGGGVSGLVCAYYLQQHGCRVQVLEAAAQPGGCIGSRREQGCLLEAGPNSALDTTPLIAALLDALGLDVEMTRPEAQRRYVVRDGVLHALPLSPMALLTTRLFSLHAKLRLLREPFIAPAAAGCEESVADFVRRRLGDEFLDYAINPFVGGVYAGDPRALSLGAAFPRLRELEQNFGSLIRGQLKGARARRRNPDKSKQSAPMFSFRDGMQALTDALAGNLERIETGARVTRLATDGDGFLIEAERMHGRGSCRARAVVLAVPAWVAAGLVAPVAADAAQALAAIPYPPVSVVHSVYRRTAVAHPLDGFGMLIPEREGRGILGTLFSSTLFHRRAPEGSVLLTTFIGGARQPQLAQLEEKEVVETAHAAHDELLGTTGPPGLTRVTRWPRAIPQYNLGHGARMARIDLAERRTPGLFFCANYRGGVAVGDCIKSAARTSGEVNAFLKCR